MWSLLVGAVLALNGPGRGWPRAPRVVQTERQTTRGDLEPAEPSRSKCPVTAPVVPETRVCIWEMHTYVEIPVCKYWARVTFDGERMTSSRQKRRELVDKVADETLGCFCEQTGRTQVVRSAEWVGSYGRVDWNVPGSLFALDAQPAQSSRRSACDPGGRLLKTLPMHPTCAWGVVQDLSMRYSTGHRVSGAEGNVLGGILNTAAKNVTQTGKSLWAWATAGVQGKLVATSVAESIAWDEVLSTDCSNSRPSHEVLDPTMCVGKVCWNFVRDFRDLWCSWWKADALANSCSLADGACCAEIAENHKAILEAEAAHHHAVLGHLRMDRFRRLRAVQLASETQDLDLEIVEREMEGLLQQEEGLGAEPWYVGRRQ